MESAAFHQRHVADATGISFGYLPEGPDTKAIHNLVQDTYMSYNPDS